MFSSEVLIVDDNPKNIQLAASMLKEHDINSAFATSGIEALERLAQSRYDLVLLDIMMPDMDGFEVCKQIKLNERTAMIPIIFVSARGDHESVSLGFECGCVDYVTKPFNEQELVSRVKVHLELRSYQAMLEEMVRAEADKRRKSEELLIQQSKMSSVGDAIGNISHQFKQPLTVTSLLSANVKQALKKSERAAEFTDIYEMLEKIDDNVQFMSDTISNFGDFFKPSKEKMMFNIANALQSVLDMVFPALVDAGIEVKFEADKSLFVKGYENEFKQVALNIVSNAKDAIKKSARRDGKIEIYVSKEERINIKICDNGGGIDADLLPEKLFESYVTTKEQSGTGIGLYMCKSIIENNFEGAISAYNLDGWACFEINL